MRDHSSRRSGNAIHEVPIGAVSTRQMSPYRIFRGQCWSGWSTCLCSDTYASNEVGHEPFFDQPFDQLKRLNASMLTNLTNLGVKMGGTR
jgi:hypothetical protein